MASTDLFQDPKSARTSLFGAVFNSHRRPYIFIIIILIIISLITVFLVPRVSFLIRQAILNLQPKSQPIEQLNSLIKLNLNHDIYPTFGLPQSQFKESSYDRFTRNSSVYKFGSNEVTYTALSNPLGGQQYQVFIKKPEVKYPVYVDNVTFLDALRSYFTNVPQDTSVVTFNSYSDNRINGSPTREIIWSTKGIKYFAGILPLTARDFQTFTATYIFYLCITPSDSELVNQSRCL